MKLFVALLLSGLYFQTPAHAAPNREPRGTAALLPLSGGSFEQGEWVHRGLDLAHDRIAEEEGIELPLHYEDTMGDPKGAISAYKNVNTRKNIGIFFTWGSGVAMALTPLVNQNKQIQLGLATGTPLYRTEGDYTFRVFHSLTEEGSYASDVIVSRFAKAAVAVLRVNNDYGLAAGDSFKKYYESAGGKIVFDQSFDVTTEDFKTLILKLKQTDAKVILVASYPGPGGILLKQLREQGIALPVIGFGALQGGDDFFKVVGTSAEGTYLIRPGTLKEDKENPNAAIFRKAYFDRYAEPIASVNWYTARAYDGMLIAAQVIRACEGKDSECLKEEMFKIKNFPGASGNISFDNCGDIETVFGLSVVKDRNYLAID